MRPLLILAALTLAAPLCSAEVIRCSSAAGSVSYTDGSCPAGSKQVGRVNPEPSVVVRGNDQPKPQSTAPSRQPYVPAAPAPVPSGPAVIGNEISTEGASGRSEDSRWADHGSDPVVAADPYAYPYGGVQRPPPRPRDNRARIRNCDGAGCNDSMGNSYNPGTGKVERYQSLDGKTCRPMGTTTVCR